MAKKLDLKTVAEGIETQAQAEAVKAMGCDIGQGYYWARPIAGNEFLELIEQQAKQSNREAKG